MTFPACQITDLVSFPNNTIYAQRRTHTTVFIVVYVPCLIPHQTKPTNAFDIRSAFQFRDSSPPPPPLPSPLSLSIAFVSLLLKNIYAT